MKEHEIIAEIWDKNLAKRIEDLENETDITYIRYIKPFVLEKIIHYLDSDAAIIDIGCGCGYLTNCIYTKNPNIQGIDISRKSIEYAQKKYNNISFECMNIYDIETHERYDAFTAVMLLNNLPNIDAFFKVAANILKIGGKGIIVIPHPAFWTIKHICEDKFSYLNSDLFYEVPFKTKGRQDYDSSIIYYHRPLQKYISCITQNGFKILEFCELPENESILSKPDLIGIIVEKNNL